MYDGINQSQLTLWFIKHRQPFSRDLTRVTKLLKVLCVLYVRACVFVCVCVCLRPFTVNAESVWIS